MKTGPIYDWMASRACFDMMVRWVLNEEKAGRSYSTMAQVIPAFTGYLTRLGWTEEQAKKIVNGAMA